MEKRPLQDQPPAFAPDGSRVTVSDVYWDELQHKDLTRQCNLTFFTPLSSHRLCFRFLREDVVVDVEQLCLKRLQQGRWQKTDDPLLELATVVYLLTVNDIYPVGKDIVGVRDLKEGHFFQGPHTLKTAPLVERYGNDVKGFRETAEFLGGEPQAMADVAYRLLPFPRVALYFLLWEGDAEFSPQITVLFDRTIENVFAADAIWALVNRVVAELLRGPNR